MRILFVCPYFYPYKNAAATRGTAFTKTLKKQDVDIMIVTHATTNKESNYEGFKVVPIKLFMDFHDLKHIFKGIKDIKKVIKDFKPDLIISSSPPIMPCWQASVAAKKEHIPNITDVRDAFTISMREVYGNKIRYKFLNILEKSTYKKSSKVMTVTDYLVNLLNQEYNIPNENIFLVPNGATLIKQDLDFEKEYDLIYIGSLEEGRRCKDLLRGIEKIMQKKPDLKVVFVGWEDSDYTKKLKDIMVELNIDENVERISPVAQDKVLEYIMKSRIGLVPLQNKKVFRGAIGAKTYEYVMAGLPISILGPEGDTELKKFVEKYGVGFNTTEFKEFAEKTLEILQNPELWQTMHENAINHSTKFDREKIFTEFYGDLLKDLDNNK